MLNIVTIATTLLIAGDSSAPVGVPTHPENFIVNYGGEVSELTEGVRRKKITGGVPTHRQHRSSIEGA